MSVHDLSVTQAQDMAKVEDLIAKAQNEIAAISPDLRAEVVQDRAEQIKSKVLEEMRQCRERIIRRAHDAAAMEEAFAPAALRRSAKFHDDAHADATIRLATYATLERTPTSDLGAHLSDAVKTGNIALVEAVRLEFSRRGDATDEAKAGLASAMSAIVYPHADDLPILQKIRGSLSMADVRIQEFLRDRSNPAGRMAAARQMGVA